MLKTFSDSELVEKLLKEMKGICYGVLFSTALGIYFREGEIVELESVTFSMTTHCLFESD